jgi:hypothetical protein
MKTRVFEPLGLLDTYVEDRYDRVVPVNATSYYGSYGNGFSRAVEYWGYVGSGNMHSTAKDLLAWMTNYYHPHPGWKKAFETMKTRGILNNGDTITYAFGIILDKYRGYPRLQHGGSIGGYRSFVQAFPEEELNTAILANFSSSDVWVKSSGVADLLLGLEPQNTRPIRDEDIKSIELPRQMLEKYCGFYWNSRDRVSRKISLKEDTLWYSRSGNSENKMLPLTENSFQMTDVRDTLVVTFQDLSDGRKEMSVRINAGDPILLQSYEPPAITKDFLESYTGRYYSPELDVHYTLYTKGDSVLMGNHVRHGDFRIDIIRENDFRAEFPAFGDIRIKRDKRKRIEGLHVSNGRVKNLWFRKL